MPSEACKKVPFWTLSRQCPTRMVTWLANNFTSCLCWPVTHTLILKKITKSSTVNLRFVSVKIQSRSQIENYAQARHLFSNLIFWPVRNKSKNLFCRSSCLTTIRKLLWALTPFHELKLQATLESTRMIKQNIKFWHSMGSSRTEDDHGRSLKKRIHIFSIFTSITPTCLHCQM